jgi:dihydroxyacetone kinase-like predicted kinase
VQNVGKPEDLTLDNPANGPDYGYDVQFLVYNRRLDLERMRADLGTIGQSILVVGDERMARVHAHVADPRRALSYGTNLGLVADVVIEDMGAQARALATGAVDPYRPLFNSLEPPSLGPAAVLVVAPGPGFIEILAGLGADQVVLRDPRLPLDSQALLHLISRIEAEQIIAAPESLETLALFRQLQTRARQNLAVLPTQTAPQAVGAMLAFNRRFEFEANVARMSQAGQKIQTVEIDLAEGQAALERLARTEVEACEIAAIYFGRDGSPEQAEALGRQIRTLYPELEIEIYHGGQPHCDYIISLE